MTKEPFAIAAVAVTILGLSAAPSFAQTRVFVSGSGSDANPCSLASPCRSFQQAHNTVLAGGEIVALDAAGYGTLNITKAITITAIGIEASITTNATTPTGITINAGASDAVTIRGISLFPGSGIAGNVSQLGIAIASAKSVIIRDCAISGFPGTGINVGPGANLNAELRGVSADNNNYGLVINPSGSGNVTALVTDSYFSGNIFGGVTVGGDNSTGTITATLSIVAQAAVLGNGISVSSTMPGHAQPVVMVTGSKLVNNTNIGLTGSGFVHVFVDRTQISGNGGGGWEADSGAVVSSYTNNNVNGNGNDGLNGVVQISSE
jgi:hypothetical protein